GDMMIHSEGFDPTEIHSGGDIQFSSTQSMRFQVDGNRFEISTPTGKIHLESQSNSFYQAAELISFKTSPNQEESTLDEFSPLLTFQSRLFSIQSQDSILIHSEGNLHVDSLGSSEQLWKSSSN